MKKYEITEEEMDLFIDMLQDAASSCYDADLPEDDPTHLFLGKNELTFREVDELSVNLLARRNG